MATYARIVLMEAGEGSNATNSIRNQYMDWLEHQREARGSLPIVST